MDTKRAEVGTLRSNVHLEGKRKRIQCRVRSGHSRSRLGVDPREDTHTSWDEDRILRRKQVSDLSWSCYQHLFVECLFCAWPCASLRALCL